MSTITRERAELKSFITGFLSDPMHDNQSTKSITAEVFRIALASLEAEPVAWRYRTTDINGNPNPRWSFSEDESLMGLYQPLYASPPAPVVSEEMPKGLAGQIVSLLAHNIGDKFLAQKIWNACRSAMLQEAK